MNDETLTVKICLGSACYARGSQKIVEALQAYIAEERLEVRVTLTGALCEEQCRKGPVITINETAYTGVDVQRALDALDEHVSNYRD